MKGRGLLVDAAERANAHEVLLEAMWEPGRMTEMTDNACLFCDEVDMWATIGVATAWVPLRGPQ